MNDYLPGCRSDSLTMVIMQCTQGKYWKESVLASTSCTSVLSKKYHTSQESDPSSMRSPCPLLLLLSIRLERLFCNYALRPSQWEIPAKLITSQRSRRQVTPQPTISRSGKVVPVIMLVLAVLARPIHRSDARSLHH